MERQIAKPLFTEPPLKRPPIRSSRGEGTHPPNCFFLLCGIAVVSAGLLSLPLTAKITTISSLFEQLLILISKGTYPTHFSLNLLITLSHKKKQIFPGFFSRMFPQQIMQVVISNTAVM